MRISTNARIPARIKIFLAVAALLFTGWQLLYRLLLQPGGIPDHILTILTGKGTATLLDVFYDHTGTAWNGYYMTISVNGKKILSIAPYCNGLELMALYTGILLALTGSARSKILFSMAGIAVIFLLNIVRCSLLAWMHMKQVPLYEFAHHYLFKLGIYLAAFYGWTLFIKYNERSRKAGIHADGSTSKKRRIRLVIDTHKLSNKYG